MSGREMSLVQAIAGMVPEGHLVARRVFARGVQVYDWDGEDWRFVGPLADLYDLGEGDIPLQQKAGAHYMHLRTPAWEFEEGRVIVERAEPIPGAGSEDVDWLRVTLRDDEENRKGLNYTHVLRIKTRLGKAPNKEAHPGAYVGQRLGLSYETYYAFLRKG